MYNYAMLIGWGVDYSYTETKKEGATNEEGVLKMKVARPFKNLEGKETYDQINVKLCNFMAKTMKDEYIPNLKICVKCRIAENDGKLEVIGERVMFFK